MGGIFLRFKAWWDTADRTQRVVTVGGAAFLLLLLAGTFVFASRPKMALAFSGLSPADTGAVAMEIEGMGMPVTYDGAGNVMVPSDKTAQVKASLAMNGKLPKSNSHPGYEGLGGLGMMNTPRVERERLKTMVEGEVARSVEFFDGVDSARVHISLGEDSPFETEKKAAQASVTISEKSGATVTGEQGRAMALLVSSAVPGLDQNKVSIFSREGRSIWDGAEIGDTSGKASSKLEMEKAEARTKRDELQQSLNRMCGAGNAIAMVTLNLDLDQVEENQTKREPSEQAINEQKVSESMADGGTASSGIAGIGSNTGLGQPGTPTGSAAGGGYKMVQQSKQRAENVTVRQVKQGVGDVRSMGVTVLVNSATIKDTAAVQGLADAFLGPKALTDKANFTAKVVAYPFDTKQQEDVAKAETAAASASRMQQLLSMLPILALVVVAFLVMRQVGKLGKNLRPVMMATATGQMLPMSGPALGSGAAAHHPAMMAIPESVRQKAMEAGIDGDALARAMAVSEQGEAIEIPDIGNKVNVPLEQIKKMSQDRPEVVAMLIKSWLLEDGIRR